MLALAQVWKIETWRLFMHFGPRLASRALTRTIALRKALDVAGKRLGLEARLVSMSDPVAAIDVDKVADHILAEQIMMDREALARPTLAA